MAKNQGFILLEVLLSLLILGSVFLFSLQAITAHIRAAATTSRLNTAVVLSQQLLSRIRLNEFQAARSEDELDSDSLKYIWEIDRTNISPNEVQYDIVIRWNDEGQARSYQLTTTRLEYKGQI